MEPQMNADACRLGHCEERSDVAISTLIRNVLTQRHKDTKKSAPEIISSLCGSVASCQTHFFFEQRITRMTRIFV
jgi:hypothetical protein